MRKPNLKATPFGLPVSFRDGRGNSTQQASRANVEPLTGDEYAAYSSADVKTCGSCRFFDLKNGRPEIIKQRFAERLVREEQWKLRHLGAPLDHVGLCGQSNGELATTTVSKACDQHRSR